MPNPGPVCILWFICCANCCQPIIDFKIVCNVQAEKLRFGTRYNINAVTEKLKWVLTWEDHLHVKRWFKLGSSQLQMRVFDTPKTRIVFCVWIKETTRLVASALEIDLLHFRLEICFWKWLCTCASPSLCDGLIRLFLQACSYHLSQVRVQWEDNSKILTYIYRKFGRMSMIKGIGSFTGHTGCIRDIVTIMLSFRLFWLFKLNNQVLPLCYRIS